MQKPRVESPLNRGAQSETVEALLPPRGLTAALRVASGFVLIPKTRDEYLRRSTAMYGGLSAVQNEQKSI